MSTPNGAIQAYPMHVGIVGLRVEAPLLYWRSFDEIAVGPGFRIRQDGPGVKGEDRSADSDPLRRTFARWRSKYGLTPSELDVLDCLSQGMRTAAIARERRAKVGTVRAQLKTIYDKTGFRSQQAILVALLKDMDAGK